MTNEEKRLKQEIIDRFQEQITEVKEKIEETQQAALKHIDDEMNQLYKGGSETPQPAQGEQ